MDTSLDLSADRRARRARRVHRWRASGPRSTLLVWQPDYGPDLAEFTLDLAPGGARILTGIHLTEQAERHNAVGLGGMGGKAPHSGIGLFGERKDFPSLAEVSSAEDVPLFTGRGLATPSEQHTGIIGLDRHAAGIGQRPFLLDAQSLPGVTQIVAGEHFACGAGIDALGLRRRDRHGGNVLIILTRLQVSERVTAVEAAEDAVDFDPGPDHAMIVG